MPTLGPQNDNLNIDGAETSFVDFGGNDTYTILPNLSADVTITDNQASTINLPEGIEIADARFSANGVQFTVNGFTVTFIGDPASFSFVFGGTPINPAAGVAKTFADTAAAFGTSIPAPGSPPQGRWRGRTSQDQPVYPLPGRAVLRHPGLWYCRRS